MTLKIEKRNRELWTLGWNGTGRTGNGTGNTGQEMVGAAQDREAKDIAKENCGHLAGMGWGAHGGQIGSTSGLYRLH